MTNLKPCPFCGGEGKLVIPDSWDPYKAFVRCKECGIEIYAIEEYMEHSIYVGDSFNDQPLFKYIPTSVGMHTVAERRDEFETLPTYITEGGPGEGWCQMAKALLE